MDNVTENVESQEDEDQEGEEEHVVFEEEDELFLQIIQKFKDHLEKDDKDVFYDMLELIITKLYMVQNNIKFVKAQQDMKVSSLEEYLDVCSSERDKMGAEVSDAANNNLKLVHATIKQKTDMEVIKKSMKNCQEL